MLLLLFFACFIYDICTVVSAANIKYCVNRFEGATGRCYGRYKEHVSFCSRKTKRFQYNDNMW